ncbi:MAG: hypothetical protein AAF928_08815 [Myxococcota bacterium]
MTRLWQRLVVAVATVGTISCGGGGDAGGGGCAGVAPLAGGFPTDRRIENVGSVRLTQGGITFIENNLGTLASLLLGDMNQGGNLTFDVPRSEGGLILGISYELCPDQPDPSADPPTCRAEVDLEGSQLAFDPVDPHTLRITGPLSVRLQDLPLRVDYPLLPDGNVNVTINGDGGCPGKDRPFAALDFEVNIDLEIEEDPSLARFGYTRVRIGDIQLDEDDLLDQIEYCNGGLTGSIIDLVDGLIIGNLVDGLVGTLGASIESQLCQPSNPALNPPCPVGTFDVEGICRYQPQADADCASTVLGLDGNFDLGSLLSGFSPGTKGAFNFLLAAGGDSPRPDGSGHFFGDLDPIANGATLGLYGGFDPTPVSNCVTPVDAPLPTGIPIPAELTANTVPGWPSDRDDPHFGFALSERFFNYALVQAYNSGALCLGVGGDVLGGLSLNTGLLGVGLGAQSISELGLQRRNQPLALMIRPNEPPTIDIGGGTDAASDPLLRLTWNQVSFDFFVWSLDRYIRAFTTTLDLDVPLDLMVTPDGLQPVVANLSIANAAVTNSDLIRENPETIAASLQELLGGLVGGLLGDVFPPVDVNGLLGGLGLTLDIPPSSDGMSSPGLRRLTAGTDDFLGIFATLGVSGATSMNVRGGAAGADDTAASDAPGRRRASETDARLEWFDIDPRGLTLDTMTPENGPRARIALGSDLDDGTRRIEWQYKVNRGLWRPFTERRYLDVADPILRVQGRHEIAIRSRVVGVPGSLDPTPEVVVLRVDEEPPVVHLREHADGHLDIVTRDNVSGHAGTTVRVRYLVDGDWSEWSTWAAPDTLELPRQDDGEVDEIEVEARDEAGHIGTTSSALIRGRNTGGAGDGGCGCRMAGSVDDTSSSDRGAGMLALAAGLAALAGRRRRRRQRVPQSGPRRLIGPSRPSSRSMARRAVRAAAFVALGGLSGCSCGDDDTIVDNCVARGDCQTPLSPGLIGSYTSAAVADDGTVWVAGYLEADWESDWTYGDLAVGRVVDGAVAWDLIDGVPTDPPVSDQTYDLNGFRGGQTEAGDDVGLWTSIAIGPAGQPAVAYYDATNRALKYARFDGSAWTVGTVQTPPAQGEVGRYAKLRFAGGVPVIAYLFVETDASTAAVQSGVRIARASAGGSAADDTTWTFEDVAVNTASPCNSALCPSAFTCTAELVCRETSRDCSEDCGDLACVLQDGAPTCVAEGGGGDTYPDALGLYVAMDVLPGGNDVGLAFYDRTNGNVVTAIRGEEGWTTTVVDGQAADGADTGDKGIGLSLDIDDAGNFHLAYVDGLDEGLNYVAVQDGTSVSGTPQLVDDGRGIGDGVHIVGDDSSISVAPSGEVQISYQDASNGTLRYAVGVPNATGHDWTTRALDQPGFSGFFSQIIEAGGRRQVVHWSRQASPVAVGEVLLVAP